MVVVALFIAFVVGALVVIGVEIVGVLFVIWKLGEKAVKEDVKLNQSGNEELQFPWPNKQGSVWILEKEEIPKSSQSTDKNQRQEKRKIEVIEVTPVRKHANIKDKSLIVTEPDGTLTKVSLSGCIVEAVSASSLPDGKWDKTYPIKVENKSSLIYHGSKLFYLYFETSCEKESWCQALRLASSDDKEKLIWFYKAREEFHSYLASLNVEYPSFLKPSISFSSEIGDRSIKVDGSSSQVRHFLKRLAKKTSNTGREDEKISESSFGGQVPSGSRNFGSQSSDANSIDKASSEDETSCCSLLISRLFFDAKSNVDLRNSIQAQIQRTLSAIRTPSYIGEIICTGVNPGNIPPHIHGMRVVPSDLKEVVAMEIDIEYYGGVGLDIETRLEVRELENRDSKSLDADVTTDILEGFELNNGEELKLNEQTNQAMDPKGDGIRKLEDTKSYKSNGQASSTVSKWKSVLNVVAKQVSQVPLSFAIRVTTLRGTLRVHIKPPPSDQIWFGFTSMPDIDFSLESSVGDYKITSGSIALFIINNFKAAIRKAMVLPSSRSVTIPFMIAEKNDWIPQQSAPFIWTNPEPTVIREVPRPQPSNEPQPQYVHTSSKSSTDTTHNETTFNRSDDEKSWGNDNENTMLLESVEQAVTFPNWQRLSPPQPQAMVVEENNETADENDAKLRRIGTRAKMLGLRKKMGEKLEEKRRHIEEKGRRIAEKMRAPGTEGI